MSSVTVEFDIKSAVDRRAPLLRKAQVQLDLQVIKDSNVFCPEAEGTLKSSALIASRIGEGLVVWDTPYARKQYYQCPKKSKDKNPNARMRWFEHAKARMVRTWRRIAQEALDA